VIPKVLPHDGAPAAPTPESFDRILAGISEAGTFQELVPLLEDLDLWIENRLKRGQTIDPGIPELLDNVSRFNEALTTRVIQGVIEELESQKGLSPPLPFCWITMGSDARGEQIIRTDQDNALIYADPLPGKKSEAADYFHNLASHVNQALDVLGFSFCKGNVMASNPLWCRSMGEWLTALDDWVGSTDADAVRNLTILLDFKAVFGDRRLAAMLQVKVFQGFEAHPQASHFLVRDDQLFAPPKKSFNRINTRRKKGCSTCFNIKTQAIAHLVNGARLFAVNHQIQVPATLKRLEHLQAEQIITKAEYEGYTSAFIFLTRLKLDQHRTIETLPANHIDVNTLDKETKNGLTTALDNVARFQKKMTDTYNQAWMNFFN